MTINEQIASGISTIVLTADTTESVVIPKWATITLNLNGYKLMGDGANHTIENNGKLIVKDMSIAKTGVVYSNVANKACIFNSYGAELTVERAILDRGEVSWYCILNWGKSVTINDIYVNLTSAAAKAAVIANGFYSPQQDNPDKVFCSCVINGGYIATQGDPNACVKNDEYGIMAVSGGTFKARMRALNNWNDCSITGGTFESETGAPIISGSYPSDGGHCDLTIQGGTFKGVGSSAIADCSEGQGNPGYVAPVWAVSGGAYNLPVPDVYCAPGYKVEQQPDGSYGPVKEKHWAPVAKAPCGIGFMGLSSAIFQIPSIEYTAGGIEPPMSDSFVPAALISASAEGGVCGYFDGQKIKLYRGASEVSGTLTNLQLIMLGH